MGNSLVDNATMIDGGAATFRLATEYRAQINRLHGMEPAELEREDIAMVNMLCGYGLPGCEGVDFGPMLKRVDWLAQQVKQTTHANAWRRHSDPEYSDSPAKWRMAMLVTYVKRHFGVAYDPRVKVELEEDGHSPFGDCRNVFIHGMLGEDRNRRWGSCCSIPVMIVAVGRRLGYPVGLAVNYRHVWVRWEDERGESFNVEASNMAGMASPNDEHYHQTMLGRMSDADIRGGFYGRRLTAAEEFGLFMKFRVSCLTDTARYAESFLWAARAMQFSPDDPHFTKVAYACFDAAIKWRYRQKYPDRPIPPLERNQEFFATWGN